MWLNKLFATQGEKLLEECNSSTKTKPYHYLVDFGGERVFIIKEAINEVSAFQCGLELLMNGGTINLPSKSSPWYIYTNGECVAVFSSIEDAIPYLPERIKPRLQLGRGY